MGLTRTSQSELLMNSFHLACGFIKSQHKQGSCYSADLSDCHDKSLSYPAKWRTEWNLSSLPVVHFGFSAFQCMPTVECLKYQRSACTWLNCHTFNAYLRRAMVKSRSSCQVGWSQVINDLGVNLRPFALHHVRSNGLPNWQHHMSNISHERTLEIDCIPN